MSRFGPCKKKHIGDYSYLSTNVLGEGYSGIVYMGKHDQTGKMCAIKIIQKSILKYQAHKSMILCQIEFLTLLKNCSKILTLLEVYSTKNNIYLVLELCNTDLKQYLTAKKSIPEPEAIDIMKNIILGYKAIWQAKIIHRDLKPSNILLQNQEIKIADFGFSVFEKDKKEYEKINVGSPYYMPLEVLAYNIYSYESDIWALGIIYYEILTGRIPWKAKTQKELFKQMQTFEINRIMPCNISQNSKEFLRKTLTIDMNKRMKPDELVCFKLSQQEQVNMEASIRSSARSEEAISLQKTLIRTKTIHNPDDCPEIQNSPQNQNLPQKSIKQNEEKEQKISEEIESEMLTGVIESQNYCLAHSRMRKNNNEQQLDNMIDLPSPQKKKKNIVRKTSLEPNYEPFENQKPVFSSVPSKLEKITSAPSSQVFGDEKPDSKQTTLNIKFVEKQEKQEVPPKMVKQPKSAQQQTKQSEKIQSEKNQKTKLEAMKKFSKVLRSQIHFCRYIYKLLMRLVEYLPQELNLIRPELKEQMAALIFQKLKRIDQQKMGDPELFNEWLQTREWEKIKGVLKQYKTRYVMGLKETKVLKEFDSSVFKKYLRKAILHLYKRAYDAFIAEEERQDKQSKTKVKRAESQKSTSMEGQNEESEIMKIKQEIIILDYLITLKQLCKLEERHGWEVFEEKSKIESIVEGEPLKYVQQKHILAISQKLQKLKIL